MRPYRTAKKVSPERTSGPTRETRRFHSVSRLVPAGLAILANLHGIACPVRLDGHLDKHTFTLAQFSDIGGELSRSLLISCELDVLMKLIEVLQGLDLPQRLLSLLMPALCRAIAHDGDDRIDRHDKCGIVAVRQTVMCHHENVNLTEGIIWRNKLRFDVPGQVATAQKFETTEGGQQADTGCIVRFVFRHGFMKFRKRIYLSRICNYLTAGRDNFHRKFRVSRLDRKAVAGLHCF